MLARHGDVGAAEVGVRPLRAVGGIHASVSTRMYSMFMGMLFCILQALAQVWHPTQRSLLMAMASFVMVSPYAFFTSTSVSENGMTGPVMSS